MRKVLMLLILIQLFSCNGQEKNNCTKEKAYKQIIDLPDIAASINKYKNSSQKIIFDISEDTFKSKNYYIIKELQQGEFHDSVWNIFYVDKKDCAAYYYDTVNDKLLTIKNWRLNKNQNKNSTMDEIKFTDLFNEGSIIKFAPKDLDKNTPEIQEFKSKLKTFELEYPLIEDFEVGNLSYLINDKTFFDSQYSVNSNWLQYFITKYQIDPAKLNLIMKEAIEKEDYDAVTIILNNHYIVSKKDLNVCSETENDAKEKIKEDKVEGYESYVVSNSKINQITETLKKKYLLSKIQDPDGYTNLRKDKNTSSEVLQKVKSGDNIEVLDNTGDWFFVKTKEGKEGYIHKSRIK